MRKMSLILLLAATLGCSTGDLQIEAINFDEASVQYCGTLTTETRLLFKLQQQEALILELPADVLRNEASAGTLERTIPGQAQVTYRIFDASADAGYFCDAIPPASPAVLEDILAADGTLQVTTVQDPEDPLIFHHTLALTGVSFVNAKGERLTDLTVSEFGTVSTTSN